MLSISLKPQVGGPPLDGCPWLHIQYIHSYPPCWKPIHPQPEDPPCYGDRDPLITGYMYFINKSMLFLIIVVCLWIFLLDSTEYQNEQELLGTVGCYHYHLLGLILLALNDLNLHMHVNKTLLQIHFIYAAKREIY